MSNHTCGYCGSGVGSPGTDNGQSFCSFCEMFVQPSVDGQRVQQYQKEEFIGYDQLRMNTPQLQQLNTKSLLEVLRFAREERRSYFGTMRTLKKASSELPEFKAGERMSSDEYEMITRKVFVVENILRDRMGYIPKKITDNLLISYKERCEDPYNDRQMIIKKPEKEKEPPGLSEGHTR